MRTGFDTFDLSLRRYGQRSDLHWHEFSQLVLPLAGTLDIDYAGRSVQLDRRLGAYVERGDRHAQGSRDDNRSLVIELDPDRIDPRVADHLATHPRLVLSAEASHLIDYMGVALTRGSVTSARLRLWAPLLLDALTGDAPRPPSRLAGLLAVLQQRPFDDWPIERMARLVQLSSGRLHALFQQELATTPRAWLAAQRLQHVQDWLAGTSLPIAEIAYRAGFADQSALTRALRRATGLTPAAYRRQAQASGSSGRQAQDARSNARQAQEFRSSAREP